MGNVKKILNLLDETDSKEIEQLSTAEVEEIEGGAATCDISCKPDDGCGPRNSSCLPHPAPAA